MSELMFIAIDANWGAPLDVRHMTDAQLLGTSGRRTAARNGYDMICRGCQAGVCLVYNHRHTRFWRHLPGEGKTCLTNRIHDSESEEHAEGKLAVATTLERLNWTVEPEAIFSDCRIDVYAKPPENPAAHQLPTAWEVQVSHQTLGDFAERTERIQRTVGCPTSWLTPHARSIGACQGVVIDPSCKLVVGRIYSEPDEYSAPLPPMPIDPFVKGVSSKIRTLIWSQSGEDKRFIVFPKDALPDALHRAHKPTRKHPRAEPTAATDRLCHRPPPTGSLGLEASPVDIEPPPLAPLAADIVGPDLPVWPNCPRCGEADNTRRFYGICHRCALELRAKYAA